MIVTVPSLLTLGLDALCGVLALGLLGLCLRVLFTYRRYREPSSRMAVLEGAIAFAGFLGVLVFLIRMIDLPLFFALLQSLVPHVPGALCGLGVTRVEPGLSLLLLLEKPIALFLLGLWLLLDAADQRTMTSPLLRRKLALLAALAAIVLAGVALETLFLLRLEPWEGVTCCIASPVDLEAPAPWPWSAIPSSLAFLVTPLYVVANVALLAAAGRASARGLYRGKLPVSTAALFGLSLLASAVALSAYVMVLAPAWMGRANHRCLYCLVSFAYPGSAPAIASGLARLAAACLLAWPWPLLVLSGTGEGREASLSLIRPMVACGAVLLALSFLSEVLAIVSG